ncbi:hypothetical protein N7535_000299 [Penicillium sp. DV-2018c]|nr:hypothetical protein N7461_006456 [Penicillium sp. DV-2018c]KAJ5581679.1 hypothetical protein N7535_000299 [Penicillium sp. DV-2018c]
MSSHLYESIAAENVTDDMLLKAAQLFNENYGRWGETSGMSEKPVKLSAKRLREEYLPTSTTSSTNQSSGSFYTRVIIDGKLVGNAFACRWNCKGKTVCWITQLVVDKYHRHKGLATGLLLTLREYHDDIYGIMSSHPAACLAAAKAFGRSIEKIDLGFIGKNANETMSTSPVPYIRDAELCGTVFIADDTTGMVSGVNTKFFVDHEEPLKVLRVVEKEWDWPLGQLAEGHEYLLVLPARRLA